MSFGNLYDIAADNDRFTTPIHRLGTNTDIDIASGFEDIWDKGGTYNIPTAARIHNIKSTSTSDDEGNVGAEKVYVCGLDADYRMQTETVTMDGTTNSPTINSYVFIDCLRVTQSNSGANDATNVGNISAVAVTDSVTSCLISAGNNQSMMTPLIVPEGKGGIVTGFYAMESSKGSARGSVRMTVRPLGEPEYTMVIAGWGPGTTVAQFGLPFKVPAKSLIKLSADTDTDNTQISAGYSIIALQ